MPCQAKMYLSHKQAAIVLGNLTRMIQSSLLLSTFLAKLQKSLDRVKRIWYFSPMRAAKVQASLGIRAVSPEPSLLAHTSSESRGTFRQKSRSLAPLNGWTWAVKICHDGMLEDINSLDGAQPDLRPLWVAVHVYLYDGVLEIPKERFLVLWFIWHC